MFKYTAFAVSMLGLFLLAPVSFADDELVLALEIENPHVLDSNILTGGQPSREDLSLLKSKGFGVVVNLRTSDEPQQFDEAEEVSSLGMKYFQIPVSASIGISRDNAEKLNDILKQSQAPVLVHCASGNRVGALFALRAYFIEGLSAETSLDLGQKAGLTRLKPLVRQILESSTPTPEPVQNL